jgi:hypothetical protein
MYPLEEGEGIIVGRTWETEQFLLVIWELMIRHHHPRGSEATCP